MKIKDIDESQIDLLVLATGSVLKAIVSIAKCIDEIKHNDVPKLNTTPLLNN